MSLDRPQTFFLSSKRKSRILVSAEQLFKLTDLLPQKLAFLLFLPLHCLYKTVELADQHRALRQPFAFGILLLSRTGQLFYRIQHRFILRHCILRLWLRFYQSVQIYVDNRNFFLSRNACGERVRHSSKAVGADDTRRRLEQRFMHQFFRRRIRHREKGNLFGVLGKIEDAAEVRNDLRIMEVPFGEGVPDVEINAFSLHVKEGFEDEPADTIGFGYTVIVEEEVADAEGKEGIDGLLEGRDDLILFDGKIDASEKDKNGLFGELGGSVVGWVRIKID